MKVFVTICVASLICSIYAQPYTGTGYDQPGYYGQFERIGMHRGGSRWPDCDSWGRGRGFIGGRGWMFGRGDMDRFGRGDMDRFGRGDMDRYGRGDMDRFGRGDIDKSRGYFGGHMGYGRKGGNYRRDWY